MTIDLRFADCLKDSPGYAGAMTALAIPGMISVEDYLVGEETSGVKHEYVGGVVHAMAGATNRHNAIASNALVTLGGQLRGKTCQSFNSDTKVRVVFTDHVRFYYPDSMVVCQPNPDADHFQDQPVVIVEVLSESTRRTDLGEKRDAYLSLPSLKVLLLVESESCGVVVYRRKKEGGFAIEQYVKGVIPLPEVNVELALEELYDRVKFSESA